MPIVIKGNSPDLVMELKLISMDGNPGYVDRSGGISCTGSCRLDVPPGKYRLRVIEPDGRRSDRTIVIREPEKFWVGPIDDGARTTGMVLGVIGTVMVPIGFYMMLQGIDDSYDNENDGQTATFGLLIFAAGAALAPVGWVMFGKSGRFTLERQSLDQANAAQKPSFSLGIAALPGEGAIPGGGQLGASFAF